MRYVGELYFDRRESTLAVVVPARRKGKEPDIYMVPAALLPVLAFVSALKRAPLTPAKVEEEMSKVSDVSRTAVNNAIDNFTAAMQVAMEMDKKKGDDNE